MQVLEDFVPKVPITTPRKWSNTFTVRILRDKEAQMFFLHQNNALENLRIIIFPDVIVIFFESIYCKWKHMVMRFAFSSVSKPESLLNENMPQLKMTFHLNPGTGACWAAVGQQCNLPKKLWNSNVLLRNNAMCNQWMPDNLGGKLRGQMGDGWIPAVNCQGSKCRRHTHTDEGEGEPEWP